MACLLAFAAPDYHLPLSLYIIQRLWSLSRRKGCFGQRLLATVPRQNRGDDERWPTYHFNGSTSRGIDLFATCKVLSTLPWNATRSWSCAKLHRVAFFVAWNAIRGRGFLHRGKMRFLSFSFFLFNLSKCLITICTIIGLDTKCCTKRMF